MSGWSVNLTTQLGEIPLIGARDILATGNGIHTETSLFPTPSPLMEGHNSCTNVEIMARAPDKRGY